MEALSTVTETISVTIPYALQGVDETVLGRVIQPRTSASWGLTELRQHASFIPLAPGDIVSTDALDVVRQIQHLEPVWTYEIMLHLPALEANATPTEQHPAMKQIAELEEGWKRAAYVTRPTNFTFLVSAHDLEWIEREVLMHPFVHHYELVRDPQMKIDLAVAIKHPDLDGLRTGPWS